MGARADSALLRPSLSAEADGYAALADLCRQIRVRECRADHFDRDASVVAQGGLAHEAALEDLPDHAAVGEVVAVAGGHAGEGRLECVLGIGVELHVLLASHESEDLHELGRGVVGEVDVEGDAVAQAGVTRDHAVHGAGVAGHDADEVAAAVLHCLDQGGYCLVTMSSNP